MAHELNKENFDARVQRVAIPLNEVNKITFFFKKLFLVEMLLCND